MSLSFVLLSAQVLVIRRTGDLFTIMPISALATHWLDQVVPQGQTSLGMSLSREMEAIRCKVALIIAAIRLLWWVSVHKEGLDDCCKLILIIVLCNDFFQNLIVLSSVFADVSTPALIITGATATESTMQGGTETRFDWEQTSGVHWENNGHKGPWRVLMEEVQCSCHLVFVVAGSLTSCIAPITRTGPAEIVCANEDSDELPDFVEGSSQLVSPNSSEVCHFSRLTEPVLTTIHLGGESIATSSSTCLIQMSVFSVEGTLLDRSFSCCVASHVTSWLKMFDDAWERALSIDWVSTATTPGDTAVFFPVGNVEEIP
mmetsp:Transcript_104881/g.146223  ORF Transcript_104881/g.146223 Transcript_104881/m.146223 type:complete len:316 (-) Transcript_104881:221-1168(-)